MTRASDSEREAIVGRLQAAGAEGRLTVEELAERIDSAYEAKTQAELEPLVADLPATTGPAPAPATPPARRMSSVILGILGGGDRRGRWRVPPRVSVINIMGGADLDLCDAVFEGPEVEITVWSLMGGSDIIVPEGVHVEMGGFALMGGNDLKLEGEPPGPGAPVVRITAWSLMGGTDVKTRGARGRSRLHRASRPPEPPKPPDPPRLH
jgi:hypothetical protein